MRSFLLSLPLLFACTPQPGPADPWQASEIPSPQTRSPADVSAPPVRLRLVGPPCLPSADVATFTVRQAPPGSLVTLYATSRSLGARLCPDLYGGRCLGLDESARLVGAELADGTGKATIRVQIPEVAGELPVHLQAASLGAGVGISPVLDLSIGGDLNEDDPLLALGPLTEDPRTGIRFQHLRGLNYGWERTRARGQFQYRACRQADLATPRTQSELDLITSLLQGLPALLGVQRVSFNAQDEASWVGVDGQQILPGRWRQGEPSFASRAAYLDLEDDGRFAVGDNRSDAILEFPPAAPTPRIDPVSGHAYRVVRSRRALTWAEAEAAASSRSFRDIPGHLATLTNPSEQAFVTDLIAEAGEDAWLGGELGSGWTWLTGETWEHEDWAPGAPQDLPWLLLTEDGQTSSDGRALSWVVEFDDVEPAWDVSTGSRYQVVGEAQRWTDADAMATAASFGGAAGHLVTVTSQAESDFVREHVQARTDSLYLGLFQDTGASDYVEPDGGWTWVTGEPFDYTRWLPGEPSNFFAGQDFAEADADGLWNDRNDGSANRLVVAELDGPQVTFDPSTGHGYAQIAFEGTWEEARLAAEQLELPGYVGHLVTIGSAAEQAFLEDVVQPQGILFIGAYQDTSSPSYSEPAGGWRWIDGSPMTFTNWNAGEPNRSDEDYAEWREGGGWNNFFATTSRSGFLVEFE